jgi:hypothetical protein
MRASLTSIHVLWSVLAVVFQCKPPEYVRSLHPLHLWQVRPGVQRDCIRALLYDVVHHQLHLSVRLGALLLSTDLMNLH